VEGDALPREKEFKALLGIPPEKRLLALVPIGVPAEWPSKEKKPIEQITHWEKF
jgi:nitroreductase